MDSLLKASITLVMCLAHLPSLYGFHCCYHDSKKSMSQIECYKENTSRDWCFVCVSVQCYIMNLQYNRLGANGLTFEGNNLILKSIKSGCHEYREMMGDMLILEGVLCFCNDKDYCNAKDWTNANDLGLVRSGDKNRSKPSFSSDTSPISAGKKTETLILFILIGIMVLFMAFCCIVLNQTCCVLGICSTK